MIALLIVERAELSGVAAIAVTIATTTEVPTAIAVETPIAAIDRMHVMVSAKGYLERSNECSVIV